LLIIIKNANETASVLMLKTEAYLRYAVRGKSRHFFLGGEGRIESERSVAEKRAKIKEGEVLSFY
jgi:hypothetical protein